MSDMFNKVIPIKEVKKDRVREAFKVGYRALEGKEIEIDKFDENNLHNMYQIGKEEAGKDSIEWQLKTMRVFYKKIEEGKPPFNDVRFTPTNFVLYWKDLTEVNRDKAMEVIKNSKYWRSK